MPKRLRYSEALQREWGNEAPLTNLDDLGDVVRLRMDLDAERDANERNCRAWAAEVERLTTEKDAMKATIFELAANLDDAEARVERLWRQLKKVTNVPDAPSRFTLEVCPCSRCRHYRHVAADIAARAKP